jgi:hypothetical protein
MLTIAVSVLMVGMERNNIAILVILSVKLVTSMPHIAQVVPSHENFKVVHVFV